MIYNRQITVEHEFLQSRHGIQRLRDRWNVCIRN